MKNVFLSEGDRVLIVAPAGRVQPGEVDATAQLLQGWGLDVKVMPHVTDVYGCFAGTVADRLDDLQQALDERDAKAILCMRGGYGMMQLVGELDFTQFELFPKLIIGYSDITVLHSMAAAYGVPSLHGPMGRNLVRGELSEELLQIYRALLFGKMPNYYVEGHRLNRKGHCCGKMVGGNLAVFSALHGTYFDFDYEGKILFIEDIGERPHCVDRMIRSLKLSGVLEHIAGLVVGQFSDYEEDESMMMTVCEMIADAVDDYSYPVCFNFPAGHVKENYPLLFTMDCELGVSEDGVSLMFGE